MNRRAFLSGLLATPIAASLPDIRRPPLFGWDLGPPPTDPRAWRVWQSLRVARHIIGTAAEVQARLVAGETPLEMLPWLWGEQLRGMRMSIERCPTLPPDSPPPSLAGRFSARARVFVREVRGG